MSSKDSLPQSQSPTNLPEGVWWLYCFQSLNAINFTIAMGAPMILLTRFLGGSELLVGLLTAIPSLMTVLQLVSTQLVERLGYRRSMMIGWGLRSLMLLFVVPLPLLMGTLSPAVLLGILVFAQLGFNIIRGVTSGAWFPWLTQLIPDELRGRFIGMEQRIINGSAFATLLLSGVVLNSEDPAAWRYSALLIFATIVGIGSSYFLGRSPDRPVPKSEEKNRTGLLSILPVARRCWGDSNFRHTVRYLVLVNFLVLPPQGFLILYIKENLGYTTGSALKFQAMVTLGVLLTSVVWGREVDRWGCKPVLKLMLWGMMGYYLFWCLGAAGLYVPGWEWILAMNMIWGVLASGHVVAAVKLMLGCCPRKNLTAEMAVIQVSLAFCTGLAPLMLGAFLNLVRPWELAQMAGMTPRSLAFALIFGTSALMAYFCLQMVYKVQEEKARSSRKLLAYLILDWPLRVFQQTRR